MLFRSVSQQFGGLAAGDEASPVQLEHNHFTRRLPDRLAQSRQETANTPLEVEYYRNGGILPYVLRQLAV